MKKAPVKPELCDPAGTRTQGPYIKSVLLYQLSYEINLSLFGSAKIQSQSFCAKTFSINYQQFLLIFKAYWGLPVISSGFFFSRARIANNFSNIFMYCSTLPCWVSIFI